MTSLLWSYFLSFDEAISSKPKFLNHEVELFSHRQVKLYLGDTKDPAFSSGILWITSHRALYKPYTADYKLALSLSQVVDDSIERTKGFLMHHAKLKFFIKPLPPRANSPTLPELFLRFSFLSKGCAQATSSLVRALHDKAWVQCSPGFSAPSVTSYGIASGRNMIEHERDVVKSTLSGIDDLSSLQTHAKELTALASRLSGSVAEAQNKGSEVLTEAETNVNTVLDSLGLSSVVTKFNKSHVEFLEQVSLEVASLLKPLLTSKNNSNQIPGSFVGDWGGIIGLVDAFCVANRARGTDLLSPNDFLLACQHFKSINCGLFLFDLPSGSRAIMTGNSLSDVFRMIRETVELMTVNNGDVILIDDSKVAGFSIAEIASFLNVSVGLIKDLVIGAEEEAILLRDESLEGLRFWLNIF
ncbi:hypothetical protein P9112_011914 [Eukaryota sp. TZLM1-RC]